MTGNPLYDYISSVAVSLTMAGNTGISPFLTLLLLGVIEMIEPELLNMGENMEILLSSWWSIAILGILAIAELVGKCIPAVDEVIDSAEVFVVPAISVLTTLATMGILPVPEGALTDAGQGQEIDSLGMFPKDETNPLGMFYRDENYRLLQEDLGEQNGFSEGFMNFTKVSLVVIGMGVALGIHLFKMIIRLSSLACSGGCCQPCVTLMEYLLVFFGVICAILVPAFAILACIVIIFCVGYVILVKCRKKKDETKAKSTNDDHGDEESQSTPRNGVELGESKPKPSKVDEAFVIDDELVDVPLPPPTTPNPEINATTY